MKPRYHSISNVVAIVYCERQAILDRRYGEQRSRDVQIKAEYGQRAHQQFEREGRQQMAQDRRCFIATAIYGADAPETQAFRHWRDTTLLPSRAGRAFVRLYYAVSPLCVTLLNHLPALRTGIRKTLDWLLARL